MKAVIWLVLLGFLASPSIHHQSSQGSCKGPGIFLWHTHSSRGYQIPSRPLVHSKAQKMAETAALAMPQLSPASFPPTIFPAIFFWLCSARCCLLPYSVQGQLKGSVLKSQRAHNRVSGRHIVVTKLDDLYAASGSLMRISSSVFWLSSQWVRKDTSSCCRVALRCSGMKRAINPTISLDYSTPFLLPQASRSLSSMRLNPQCLSGPHLLSIATVGLLSTQDLSISFVNHGSRFLSFVVPSPVWPCYSPSHR